MSKNKIIIDLRRIPLTADQVKELHTAIHKTVVNQLKKGAAAKPLATGTRKRLGIAGGAAAVAVKAATITVTFTNVVPGKSELRAILHGQKQTISKSGTIAFPNVKTGDIILIQGDSLGTTTVTIDVSAEPTQMNFSPGNFHDNFFIN